VAATVFAEELTDETEVSVWPFLLGALTTTVLVILLSGL
jgi:hypothetical protein